MQLLAGTDAGKGLVRFECHRPEQTRLYKLVERYYPDFEMQWASEGRALSDYARQEFGKYLKCGRLEHGFLRVQCETCHAEHLVAFSCKRKGFCPSCGARRMAESAALLVDEVLPHKPMRQCGGVAKVMACIEDPVLIKTILAHLEEKAPMDSGVSIPDSRAQPQARLFS